MRSGGLRRLQRRKASGRPPRLTRQQRQSVVRILKRGALAAGFPTDRWTLARIQQGIEREFGVHYNLNYLSALLQNWGWSVQQPVARALERDDELVEAWLAHDWPRIKKGAALARDHRIFR
jgi:transposase